MPLLTPLPKLGMKVRRLADGKVYVIVRFYKWTSAPKVWCVTRSLDGERRRQPLNTYEWLLRWEIV